MQKECKVSFVVRASRAGRREGRKNGDICATRGHTGEVWETSRFSTTAFLYLGYALGEISTSG